MLNDDIFKILKNENFNFIENNYINDFNTDMYRIDIYRKDDKLKFLDWIYGDCNIYLDRKYKKYLKVKERYTSPQSLAI